MNSYLSHLVTKLKEFWHGIEIPIPHSISKRAVVKVALAGVAISLLYDRYVDFLGIMQP